MNPAKFAGHAEKDNNRKLRVENMEKKTFDAAFEREMIRLAEDRGEKTAAVARKLGVTNKTLYRWISECHQEGAEALPEKRPFKPKNAELRRLKRENHALREEKAEARIIHSSLTEPTAKHNAAFHGASAAHSYQAPHSIIGIDAPESHQRIVKYPSRPLRCSFTGYSHNEYG